jgi:hypothetical protein
MQKPLPKNTSNTKDPRTAEIKKWRSYVEASLEKGKIYAKGIEELQRLKFDISIYSDQFIAITNAEKQALIAKWAFYCGQASAKGEDYVNGYDTLTELGAVELVEKHKAQAANVRAFGTSGSKCTASL